MRRPDVSLTEEEMAQAMYAGDASYDGLFYTCVTSTGIFCFPSCPARKPRRENVRFACTRDEAVAWGFRPCKRCRPDLEAGRRSYEALLMEKVQSLVEQRLDRITIEELSTAVSVSPHHLMRLFRRSAGVPLHEYILRRRIARSPGTCSPWQSGRKGATWNPAVSPESRMPGWRSYATLYLLMTLKPGGGAM